MTAEESLRIVRRGLAREMRMVRGLRRDGTASRYIQGYDAGWLSCLWRFGRVTKRVMLAIQQEEGAG
jgi:hypothetical protein